MHRFCVGGWVVCRQQPLLVWLNLKSFRAFFCCRQASAFTSQSPAVSTPAGRQRRSSPSPISPPSLGFGFRAIDSSGWLTASSSPGLYIHSLTCKACLTWHGILFCIKCHFFHGTFIITQLLRFRHSAVNRFNLYVKGKNVDFMWSLK